MRTLKHPNSLSYPTIRNQHTERRHRQ